MIIRFDTMFTDTNEIQVFINHGSEPVGILSKFSIYIYMGVESLKRREASPMEVAFTLFWLKIAGPLSITIK